MTADEVFAAHSLDEVIEATLGACHVSNGVNWMCNVLLCSKRRYSVRLGLMPYEEAQRLVREINELIALRNKMKGG